jgi:hypothetical protein
VNTSSPTNREYRCSVPRVFGDDPKAVVTFSAPTASKARYRAFKALKDCGYKATFADIRVTVAEPKRAQKRGRQ